MSHQQRKLSEALRQASYLKVALKSETSKSEYCRGVYNGFEIINSLILNKEPELVLNESRDEEIETHVDIEKQLNDLLVQRDEEILKLKNRLDAESVKDELIRDLNYYIEDINKTMNEEKINLGMMNHVTHISKNMKLMIDSFFSKERQNGWKVVCDETNNTAEDRENNRLNIDLYIKKPIVEKNYNSGEKVIWLKHNTEVEFLHDAPDVAINHAKTCHIRTESGEGFYVPYEAIKKIY